MTYVPSSKRSVLCPIWLSLSECNLVDEGIHTYRLIQVFIPHIVDCASRPPHDEGSYPEQTDVGQRGSYRCFDSIRSHED